MGSDRRLRQDASCGRFLHSKSQTSPVFQLLQLVSMLCVIWLSYLQQQIVVDPGEDGRVVVDVADGDGDENCRGQRRTAFICRLHRQRVMRDLGRGRR